MIFNSWRPLPDGREIANRKNNLWLTRRTPKAGPRRSTSPASIATRPEESYTAIAPDGLDLFLE